MPVLSPLRLLTPAARAHPPRRRPTDRRRSARVALATGLLLTVLGTFVLSTALETTRPEWRDPEFGHRLRLLHQHQRAEPGRPIVLVLGTSRTQNAIAPAAMGLPPGPGTVRVFNFGQSGAVPLKLLLTLRRVVDEGVRPSAILVEVLPVWLTTGAHAEDQFRETAPQLSYRDIRDLEPYCADAGRLQRRWLAARALPWQAQRASLMSHWLPQWLPWQKRISFQWLTMDADGFAPFLYAEPPADFRAAATHRAREQHAHAFNGIHLGATSLQALRDLIAFARTEGISIAFYEPPVAPTFRGWFRPGVWEAADHEVQEFARELGVDVFAPPDFLIDGDFADGHHLLRSAARRYSTWLAEAHLRPWVEGARRP